MDVRESYDSAAEAYAQHLATELDRKPLDRHLLNRFAEAMRGRGVVADLGCGHGHVAAYLHKQGVPILGIDLSAEMVRVASKLNPGLEFRAGDMRRLDIPTASLAGVVAFYSIVHFSPSGLSKVFQEMRRTLTGDGLALVAFHIGDGSVHLDELFGAPVSLDFQLHQPEHVVDALQSAALRVIERVEREPYVDAEYPSRRCYLLATAT